MNSRNVMQLVQSTTMKQDCLSFRRSPTPNHTV